ncbi:acyl-CoA dehydrogenase family protein [Hydrogenophaga sp. BPS33]|uniref:acyl-CoA dehydrogenase family protein n=1 Tax=Hydrogenophaga sp. BPS33 TaxID=2651974 RepID=UPI00131FAA8E|nr:acyl-CoA dehydrogenase family protein [Hydrogenophaga sp. BPS33]QHE84193.1 pimeloyl-CoA dehydrogenase large subunit [Hydrogenophaga sp. BPS33]
MQLRLSDSDLAFRDQVRAFLSRALPADLRDKVLLEQRLSRDDLARWHRILDDQAWAAPAWPVKWGGTGWTGLQQNIFREEMAAAFAPEPLVQNINLAGPLIANFGNEAQKAFFLPAVRRLDIWFSQGFSEPGAGSDLASLRTRARLEGDRYVVDGQKIWSTDAQLSDWMFCLVRTAQEARPQKGLTFLLIDMRTPGITVRPIPTIDGDHYLNEVFFDGVEVPADNLLGEEGRGWDYARSLLAHERIGIARTALTRRRLRRARHLAEQIEAQGDGLAARDFRLRIAALEVELRALEMTALRAIQADGTGGPDPSVLKLKGTELQQASTELLVELGGPLAMVRQTEWLLGEREHSLAPTDTAAATATYFQLRAASIYGGSNEIQRNILARKLLAN